MYRTHTKFITLTKPVVWQNDKQQTYYNRLNEGLNPSGNINNVAQAYAKKWDALIKWICFYVTFNYPAQSIYGWNALLRLTKRINWLIHILYIFNGMKTQTKALTQRQHTRRPKIGNKYCFYSKQIPCMLRNDFRQTHPKPYKT